MTCAHESNRRTDRETDKAMAIGEIADVPKNLLPLHIIHVFLHIAIWYNLG